MARRPLALTDEQLQLVLSASRSVHPRWRNRWLAIVAADIADISDADVAAATERAVSTVGDVAA
jgi:hypothetical protein